MYFRLPFLGPASPVGRRPKGVAGAGGGLGQGRRLR